MVQNRKVIAREIPVHGYALAVDANLPSQLHTVEAVYMHLVNGVMQGVGVPMKRLANPIEVGELFAFLGSDESSYLTGSQIVIDGGSTLPETMSIGTN